MRLDTTSSRHKVKFRIKRTIQADRGCNNEGEHEQDRDEEDLDEDLPAHKKRNGHYGFLFCNRHFFLFSV